MRKRLKCSIALLAGCWSLVAGQPAQAVPFHVTYLWHMHQPIYYPYESPQAIDAAGRFQFSVQGVWDSDRHGCYKTWPRDAVQAAANRSMAHAGAQMSYSGSLGENNNNLWGYCTGSDWDDGIDWARNGLRTSLNNPRLDPVGIAYHHSLMPLTCKESMKMQIRLHKELYKELWDTSEYSKGFWPPECAFDVTMVPALVEEGLEWVIVDNGHLFRTVPDFPWNSGSSCRPNPADVRNPGSAALGSQWVQLQNIWAPTAVLAPWSYQPHYVRYVNPENGQVQKIIAVPAGRYEGNENGRGGYGSFKPQNVWGSQVGVNNNPNKPMLILCHSDGDNFGMKNSDAWHGQHEAFLDMCQANADFDHTSVQDYLSLYPPDANDVIHVEPGSWIGIDGGTPYYEKWLSYENRSGEMPDMWSWSILVAAQNRVLHADALENSYLNLGGGRTMDDVQWGIGNDTARAWHWYLVSETSCYWYWDYDRANPWDGNATRACNAAITDANKVIGRHAGVDPVGPSLFPPQRVPYNPGGKMWNETANAPADFDVWTFAEDVNGISAVRLLWRRDKDGQMPMSSTRNEVYAGGADAEVEDWNVIGMTNQWWPSVRGPNVPPEMNRAMRYSAHINAPTNSLLDYFVEAVDTRGNTNRSNIIHVYVGEGAGGGGGGAVVTYAPDPPRRGENCTITYNSAGRDLATANPVRIHLGFNGWATVVTPDPAMSGVAGGLWTHTFLVGDAFNQIDCAFNNNGAAPWDNNGGQNWAVAVAGCVPPPPPPYVTITNPVDETITVPNATASYTVSGTCGTGLVGHLNWIDSLGGSGTMPATPGWNTNVALAVGTNVITVWGTNAPAASTRASDSATNSIYNAGWSDGQNGGAGFGPWQFYRSSNDSTKAGWFLANGAADCNIGAKAWGLYANSGELSEAKRPFSSPMAAGDTFRVKFDNGTVGTGGSVGIALQNAGGGNLWECYYQGGLTNYIMTGTNTGLAAGSAGMDVEFALTSPGSFSVRLSPYGGSPATFAGALQSQADSSVALFRVWNYKAGSGSGADLYIGDLSIAAPGVALMTGDTVRIIRETPGGYVDTDGDQIDDAWESLYGLQVGLNDASGNPDHDELNNHQEFLCDTDPGASNALFGTGIGGMRSGSVVLDILAGPPTTNTRVYEVLWCSNLLDSVSWTPFGISQTGRTDGGAVTMTVTNDADMQVIRTGVRLP